MSQSMKTFLKIFSFAVVLGTMAPQAGSQVAPPPSGVVQVGDRIALRIEGAAAFMDTVVVREGVVIQIPNIGDISVQGVRRADLQSYLAREIAKYVKEPVVHATPLIRIAVVGAVAKPGFYSVPSDILLSDAIMLAGGPGNESDLNRSKLIRNGKEVAGQRTVSQALAAGATLDAFQVTSGDQIVIGEKSRSFDNIVRIGGAVIGLAGLALALSR